MLPARAVLALAAILSLWNLWGYDLWAPDEPYFAEGAREMLAEGRWAVPHVNGEVTTDKPPLFFWLIALLSLPFGRVGELTARLPSALAALGSVALTIRLGRRTIRAAPEPGARHALGALSGLILATSYLFWDKSRSAQIDSLLCFLILVALSAFESFRAGDARGGRAGLLFWTACALGVVAKGPVGLLVPLGIALCTLASDGSFALWKRFAPAAGPASFVLLVGAWMALATAGGGGEYSVWGAFRQHVLERATSGMHHVQPFWYYLKVLPAQLLPWSLLLPGALLLAWCGRHAAPQRFLLVWALFVVGFFSIWTEKRDLYVLPAYPAFALLIARLVAGAALRSDRARGAGGAPADAAVSPRWITLPQTVLGVILCLAALAAAGAALRGSSRVGPDFRPAALAVAAALALGGAGILLAARRLGPLQVSLALAAAASLLYLTSAATLFPALNPARSARLFAAQIRDATAGWRAAGGEILSLGLGNITDAVAFYSDGVYLRRVSDPAEIAAHLDTPPGGFAVADDSRLESLPPQERKHWAVVASANLSGKRLVLLRGAPR